MQVREGGGFSHFACCVIFVGLVTARPGEDGVLYPVTVIFDGANLFFPNLMLPQPPFLQTIIIFSDSCRPLFSKFPGLTGICIKHSTSGEGAKTSKYSELAYPHGTRSFDTKDNSSPRTKNPAKPNENKTNLHSYECFTPRLSQRYIAKSSRYL